MFHIQLVFEVIVRNIDHHVDVLLMNRHNELVAIDDRYHRLYYTKKISKEKKLNLNRRNEIFLFRTSPNCLTSQIYDDALSTVDNGRIFEQIVLFHTWHVCNSNGLNISSQCVSDNVSCPCRQTTCRYCIPDEHIGPEH